MKRTTFAAVIVSAAVLLTSCTSTDTTATGSSPAPGSSVNPAAGSAVAGSTSAVVPSAVVPNAAGSNAAGSGGAPDGTTAAWFTAFCAGLTPVLAQEKAVQAKQASVAKDDYATQQKLLVNFLSSDGPLLTDTAALLGALPPPTFSGGSAFAAKVVQAFAKTGPGLTATGKSLAAADITKGGSALSAAAPNLAAELASIAAPITAVGELNIPDATKGALLALPACAQLQSTVTG